MFPYLGRLKGILCRENDVYEKGALVVGRVLGHEEALPHQQVRLVHL